MIYFGLNDELAERLGLEATSEFSNVIKHIQAVAQSEIPPIAVIDLGTATVKPPLVQALVRVAKEKTAYAEVLVFVPREERPKVEHEYFSAGVSGVFSGEMELEDYLNTKRKVFSTTEVIDDDDIDKLLEEMTSNLGDMVLEGPEDASPEGTAGPKLEVGEEDAEVILQEAQEQAAWEVLWGEFEKRQETPGDRPATQRPPEAPAPVEETTQAEPEEALAIEEPREAPGYPTLADEAASLLEEADITLDLSDITLGVKEEAPQAEPEAVEEVLEELLPEEMSEELSEEMSEELPEEVEAEYVAPEVQTVGPVTAPWAKEEDEVPPPEPLELPEELLPEPSLEEEVPVVEEAAPAAAYEPPEAVPTREKPPVAAGKMPKDILREVAAVPIAVQGVPRRQEPVVAPMREVPAQPETPVQPVAPGAQPVSGAVCLDCGMPLDAMDTRCPQCGIPRGTRRQIPEVAGTAAPGGGEKSGGLWGSLFGGRKKQAQPAVAQPAQPAAAGGMDRNMDKRFDAMPDAAMPPQVGAPVGGADADDFSAKALDLLKIQRDPNEKPPETKRALLSLRGSGKPAVRGVAKKQGIALDTPVQFNPPKLITVFSPKGGVGKTTVSLNMGAQLAMGTRNQMVSRGGHQQKGLDVVVVDMDLFQGGAHYRVADITEPNIISLIQNIGSIHSKEDLVTNYLLTHRDTRLRLLLRPATPSEARSFTDHHLTFVLKILLLYFDLIILDCPPEAETKVTEKALELSDLLLLVTEPENVSLTNARRMLPRLLQIKQQDQVKLIVNKWTSKCGISWEQITRWFNYIETIGQIPEHTEFFMASANTMSLPLLAGNKSVLTGYVNLGNNVISSLNKLQRGRARPMAR